MHTLCWWSDGRVYKHLWLNISLSLYCMDEFIYKNVCFCAFESKKTNGVRRRLELNGKFLRRTLYRLVSILWIQWIKKVGEWSIGWLTTKCCVFRNVVQCTRNKCKYLIQVCNFKWIYLHNINGVSSITNNNN